MPRRSLPAWVIHLRNDKGAIGLPGRSKAFESLESGCRQRATRGVCAVCMPGMVELNTKVARHDHAPVVFPLSPASARMS